MTNKLNLIAACRKTRLVYQLNNQLYQVDIDEVGDLSKQRKSFKTLKSRTTKLKQIIKGGRK
tara:strand:- start:2417 stop:2602 length:186 start_codon:yes stop_codon:yes gene_type:complete